MFGTPDSLLKAQILHPYGFISYDQYYDSRQIMGARENYVLFWPLRCQPDKFCNDINAYPSWNMTAIQTRFGVVVAQPWYYLTAKAVIEGDLLGATDALQSIPIE